MIYTDLIKKAMNIAYDAHHGQCDKVRTTLWDKEADDL